MHCPDARIMEKNFKAQAALALDSGPSCNECNTDNASYLTTIHPLVLLFV